MQASAATRDAEFSLKAASAEEESAAQISPEMSKDRECFSNHVIMNVLPIPSPTH